MSERKHVPRAVPDLVDEQVERLKQLFPEAFPEGRLDCEKLKETIGEIVDDSPERYSFTWAGKRDAIRMLQQPAWAALAPDREESVNFDETNNIFIEGENLEVLKLLYNAYFGRVKMIYIDPPYNTGNDFVYPDNYADPMETYLALTEQRDEHGNPLTSNPETSGRYHSAWLSMMYPRLFLARQLLRDDGVIFVSIDDNEVHNLRMLMNEVFGEENFICQIVWKRRSTPPNDQILGIQHEYVLVYCRDSEQDGLNLRPRSPEQVARYTNPDDHPKGPWAPGDLMANVKGGRYVPSLHFPITNPNTGEQHWPSSGGNWRFNREKIEELIQNDEIDFGQDGKGRPRLKRFLSDVKDGITWTSIWDFVPYNAEASQEMETLFGNLRTFENPKPTGLVANLLRVGMDSGAIVLDFFAGSATTAHSALELTCREGSNLHFVLVQLPEPIQPDSPGLEAGFDTIADIGRERIRRVIARLEEDEEARLDLEDADLDLGFRAFRLQPSNLRPWPEDVPAEAAAVSEELQRQIDPLRDGWTEEAVIAEVALKEGFGLNYRLSEVDGPEENTVYRVVDPDKDQTLFICLDEKLHDEAWQALPLKEEVLFVCRDVALTDTQAANLALHCKLHTI